jgi:hypothetical protein
MLQLYVQLDGINYPLPNDTNPELKHAEQMLKDRFIKISEEFPNEDIVVTGKLKDHKMVDIVVSASDPILYRLNVLDNEPIQTK